MSAPAAISGDFCTFRHVQGRKVLQIVIEVPAEAASAVFAALGMPGGGEGIPVALARLTADAKPLAKQEAPKERRRFSELPYSQQAAMRCQELGFQNWLGTVSVMDASSVVRLRCGVTSRADIIKGTPAGNMWEAIEADYYAESRGMR